MLPVRKSPRLEGCDYTQAGAYFVTICTHQRMHLLGRVLAEGMAINAWGQVAQACWEAIPAHFPQAAVDAFAVMPNHIHGIVVITDDGGRGVGATHGSPVQISHGAPPSPSAAR